MNIQIVQDIDCFTIKLPRGKRWVFYWEDMDVEDLVEVFEELGHDADWENVY